LQGGGVVSQRNDIRVRTLRVVLASGAEEGEMQLELAPVGIAEQPPQLLVPASCPPVCLCETFHFVRGLAGAQTIERPHQRGWIHVRDLQLRRGALLVSDESCTAGRKRRELDHLERRPEMIDLRRSGRFPKALCRRTHEDRLSSGYDDQQASRFRQGKPMLEMRSRAQRPILVVRAGSLQRRTGMNGERVESSLVQRRRDFPRQLLDVCSMQITEFHGDYAFKSLLLAIH